MDCGTGLRQVLPQHFLPWLFLSLTSQLLAPKQCVGSSLITNVTERLSLQQCHSMNRQAGAGADEHAEWHAKWQCVPVLRIT